MSKYIRLQVICVVPVPPEVRDSLDAVAEAGLSALREHLEANITTMVPGTLHTSWQSMPKSWQPKKSNVVLEEQLAPGISHQLIEDEEGARVTFVDVGDPDTPSILPPPRELPNAES